MLGSLLLTRDLFNLGFPDGLARDEDDVCASGQLKALCSLFCSVRPLIIESLSFSFFLSLFFKSTLVNAKAEHHCPHLHLWDYALSSLNGSLSVLGCTFQCHERT